MMKTLTIATGNTYFVKEDLKNVGFVWNPAEKRWESENPDMDKWYDDYCRLGYCGRRALKNQEINFETIDL